MAPFTAFDNSSISKSLLPMQSQHLPRSADSNNSLSRSDISGLSVAIVGVFLTAVTIFGSWKCWRRWKVFLHLYCNAVSKILKVVRHRFEQITLRHLGISSCPNRRILWHRLSATTIISLQLRTRPSLSMFHLVGLRLESVMVPGFDAFTASDILASA
jgi:hypothetical protein